MQNINVLIKGTERQSEKAEENLKRLEKNQQSLKQAIEMLQTQMSEIETKEENLLKDGMHKNLKDDTKDHTKYE
mgnify:CR=1 FL=1